MVHSRVASGSGGLRGFCNLGLDGVPPFPWWQRALLNLFNLVLSWRVVPTLWKRSIVVPVFKRVTPVSPPTIALSLLHRAASISSSIAHLFPSRRLSGRIPMGADVLSLMFCHHADLLSYSLLLWNSKKRLTQRGLRALWSAFMRWG